MNKIVSFALYLFVIANALNGAAIAKFITKYDNVNLDEILNNDRLFGKYFDCIMEKPGVKCTADGLELKNAIPEAIKNECAPCSEKQKEGARKVMKFLHDKKPKEWEAILNKYDPRGEYKAKYEKEWNNFFKER